MEMPENRNFVLTSSVFSVVTLLGFAAQISYAWVFLNRFDANHNETTPIIARANI